LVLAASPPKPTRNWGVGLRPKPQFWVIFAVSAQKSPKTIHATMQQMIDEGEA
jgi:hypothetical protein